MKVFQNATKLFGLIILSIIIIVPGGCGLFYGLKNRKAKKQLREVAILYDDGFHYRDLNKNLKLDIYEDNRQPTEKRIDDLLSQMTLEEKVGMMWQPPIGVGRKGQLLGSPNIVAKSMNSAWDEIVNRKINHFNLMVLPEAKYVARWSNNIQKLAEQTRLGIPVTISTDPRHGIFNFMGPEFTGGEWSRWPEPIGFAAIGDSSLVFEFGKIVNAEYRAVGIRAALHPMADLATEPRWARINGTFGEDAWIASKLVAAYIYGMQGDTLGTESVACMTKHWPGGGPQENGEDAHFDYGSNQVYPGNNFNYHLIPFEAAIEAGTAMMMPYYGIPSRQTNEEVGMSFNKEIISELLRKKYAYDGVVCTDWGIVDDFSFMGITIVPAKKWGVENLTVKERIKKVIDAGVDQFGGNNNTKELIELVEEGQISEARIDESVRRLLKVKFQLGLFDIPYVEVENAEKMVNNPQFIEKGKLAQRKSIVLLKNNLTNDGKPLLPIKNKTKIYVENIDKNVAAIYAEIVEKPEDADFILIRTQAPFEKRNSDIVEKQFHQGSLEFSAKEMNHIDYLSNIKPIIICIYLDRPAIIAPIDAACQGLLCDFGAEDDAVLDVIFGNFNPSAILPIEIPRSMQAVNNQKEDLPYDSENPLYPFGFGLTY